MAVRAWTAGVRLRAGAIPALTGLAARELTDASIPIEQMSWARAGGVMERLEDARTPDEAAAVLLSCLRARLGAADGEAMRAARLLETLRTVRGQTVRRMAAELGLAERTLHHLCVTKVGLGPRRIARILRMHGALNSAITGTDGWARIAARHDYADQSHLIREFQELLGESPVAFLKRAAVA
jgi:AraC-like DNA-binding protein